METRPEQIRDIRMNGEASSNRMERMNGELRQTEKLCVLRPDTAILAAMKTYHNYVRPHEAFNGRTRSEATGIKVECENRGLTLIQNAKKANGN